MIIRDSDGGRGIEVLMVKRTPRAAFGATAWVFPGGRVDSGDEQWATKVLTGLSDREASELLELEHGGLAWWLAAVRETWEEAGLLVGAGNGVELVPRLRALLDAQEFVFGASLQQLLLRLDITAMFEVARFTTPIGPPRRFDTRFFVAEAPRGQSVQIDEQEIVEARWILSLIHI